LIGPAELAQCRQHCIGLPGILGGSGHSGAALSDNADLDKSQVGLAEMTASPVACMYGFLDV